MPKFTPKQTQSILDAAWQSVAGQQYLSRQRLVTTLAEALFTDGVQTPEQYEHVVAAADYLATQQQLPRIVSLNPPHVPFDQRGEYYAPLPPIPDEARDRIEHYLPGTTNSFLPIYTLSQERLVRILRRYCDDVWTNDDLHMAARAIAEQHGYTVAAEDDPYDYLKPIEPQVDIPAAISHLVRFIGNRSGTVYYSDLCNTITHLRYGSSYRITDYNREHFTDEHAAILEAVEQANYVVSDTSAHQFVPRPLLIDDALQDGVRAVVTQMMTEDPYLYLDDLTEKLQRAFPSITTQQHVQQLEREALQPVLQSLNYDTKRAWNSQDRRYFYQPLIAPTFPTEDEIRVTQVARGGTANIPVFNPLLAIDGNKRNLIICRLVGHPEAVKANWAALVSGRNSDVRINGTPVVTSGSEPYTTLRTVLPNGLVDWLLIHKQASPPTVNPDQDFYVLSDNATGTPDSFFDMLDAALHVPLLADWSSYLWSAGREAELITAADRTPYGIVAWTVQNDADAWADLIAAGLKNGLIHFPAEAMQGVGDDLSADVISTYTVEDGLDDGLLIDGNDDTLEGGNPLAQMPVIDSAFPLGQLVMTAGIHQLWEQGLNVVVLLQRHAAKDWGDLDDHDQRANATALLDGYRIFSCYETQHGKVYVITEHDRSVTTVLLPSEY